MASAEPRTLGAARLIRVEPGPPFGAAPSRRRPVGRIGGFAGGSDRDAVARLLAALGPGATLLPADGGGADAEGTDESRGPASSAPPALVADWDRCFLDGAEIRDEARWRAILDAGRLSGVEGGFVLAARRGGVVTLARDAIGERSLFYALAAGGLVFASSVRALLASGLVARRLSAPALARYLTYAYLPGRSTLLEGVFELLPGEVLTFARGHLASASLWEAPHGAVDAADEAGLTRRLRHALEEAVRRRLPDSEDVGAFLSGGLDSSAVVALAARLHGGRLRTYSVSFGSDLPNELAWSSLVAERCGTAHTIVELSPAAVLAHLDEAIGLLSDPIGDPLTVPNALLFREAAREVGVVLNGEGGDPCFGGPKNLPMLLAELYGDDGTEDEDGHARARSYMRAHLKCYDDLGDLLAPGVLARAAEEPLEDELTPLLSEERHGGFVSTLMALNVRWKGAHHILPKVDAESAPFGVLPRAPLFDRRVVEVAFEIPPRLKLNGSVEKYLLKRAVADVLPREILERPKSGMLVPVEAWFRGPLLHAAKERLLDGLAPRGLFRRAALERLLTGRLPGLRPRRGVKIWLLVTLEAWLRTVLDGGPPAD